ncbi:MAG: hypothetical protein JWO36_6055 [Myxococcales bacterium]|nr:hypothetical protein [Myxococcales bacterium]
MNAHQRDRLAAPVVLVYWLMLVGGLGLLMALRGSEGGSLLPLWVGAIVGTAAGQALALRDFRLWVVIAVLFVLVFWLLPFLSGTLGSSSLWKAFVPAILCGYWSLGDRASLTAFWFPAVIWMLSILDRTNGQTTPDGAGIVLLGGVAVLFVVFLRVHESRRVGLWSAIAAQPLARAIPPTVLKERPGRHVARVSWGFLVSSITFAITAWIAPRLWRVESFDGHAQATASTAFGGTPCCPAFPDVDSDRTRVKEYFDLGLTHSNGARSSDIRCHVCTGFGTGTSGLGTYEPPHVAYPPVAARDTEPLPVVYTGTGAYEGSTVPAGIVDSRFEETVGEQDPWPTYQAPDVMPPSRVPDVTPPSAVADLTPSSTYGARVPTVTTAPTTIPLVTAPAPAPVPTPPPTPATHPNVAPAVEPPNVSPAVEHPNVSPAVEHPNVAPDVEHPNVAPVAEHPSVASKPKAGSSTPPPLLQWLMLIVAAALVFQVVNLALRPFRRMLAVRHLRRPFWKETIDQRVSNSWQLALVGLRDAGWRASGTEAPREFAQRTGVDGLERCATILERTRHGIGIDAEDLSQMSASAESVYRSARAELGPIARVVAALRWPLT